ncbi:MAG: DUF362 domain-containing protein [Acidobacteriota bacterium]|jgi:uncharacterized protein (DUF362 family)|nr:DUF362 domain-containing protein [Acidobacteriota bacterium]
MRLTRREFSRLSALSGLALFGEVPASEPPATPPPDETTVFRVAVVKTTNREEGVARAVALLDETAASDFSGKDIYLKGSYNSPDPSPATTHPDALRAVVRLLRDRGAKNITLVERSGMGRTREVVEKLDALDLLRKLEIAFYPLDEIPAEDWCFMELDGSHWPKGIAIPSFLRQDICVVQLCTPKTHRFGGEFSASLKNSIGLIAKRVNATERKTLRSNEMMVSDRSRNFMADLHASPFMGQMVAEVNQVYAPAVVVMDATEVFVAGGPEKGEIAHPEIIAASQDRVALDAVGFSILQHAGARIGGSLSAFEQPQIKRAVELHLGASYPEEIEIVSDDRDGRLLARRLESILRK